YKKNIKPIFFLMNTRNRKQIPTSASDIALKENTPVLSPVTGIISKVIDYKLYKKYDDIKIEIIPDQNKDFKVKIIHLKNVVVKKGEKVKVGDSLGRVRTLSDKMNIQIGRYLPIKIEHIHIQVEKRGV
ncbi:MAG: peptidoglycan DD-metalloendopeptidase family protein, partial [Actinomycetia bacterium]|nr:peptidoglycan DD-metalloendopeptidase family protein [Actinomycetes bacterium]